MSHSTPHPHSTSSPTGTGSPSRTWADGPLLGFDTETTGVSPTQDRLVTAALVWRGPRLPDDTRAQKVRTWLADPGVEIPAAAAAVHGITTQRARAQGRPAAEVLEEVAGALATAMAQGTPVVAFNAPFDLTLMEAELARHGLSTLRQRLGGQIAPVLDLLVLDRAVDRYRKGKRRLGDVCAVYGVQVDEALHTAEVDVAATLDVLEAMARVHPRVAGTDLAALQGLQAEAHRAWAESLNQWLTRRGRTPDADPSWPLASTS
ncbi:exonuclease domain-containing protein [Actinomyces gaoshouyii]|uniref:exonuclease domain-containing protein n=1 Tax=Actinomyces gaoshouyii TaxID=1960083 RepID=UPI0009C15B10|nr:exonuclease domain-containing protein [Actinomyces gaoshouyii]ARD42108.1 DNA polymerase III subunit epsilon [Actinomyces gaoshouyii]